MLSAPENPRGSWEYLWVTVCPPVQNVTPQLANCVCYVRTSLSFLQGRLAGRTSCRAGARAPSSEEAENRPQTRPNPRAINGCKITHSIEWPIHKRNSFVKYKGVVWKSVFRVHDGCEDMPLKSSLNNSRKWRENILHHPTALPEVRVKLEPCLPTAYTISNRENEQSQS